MRAFSVTLLAVLPCLSSVSFIAADAQGRGAGPPPAAAHRPIVIDGSKNPEAIPERTAVAIFFSHLAIPADADKKAVAVMEAKLARAKFTRNEMRTIRAELASLHPRIVAQRETIAAANQEARRARSPEAAARATAALEQRNDLTWNAYTRLIEFLGSKGAKKLRAHIEYVKTGMKAYGPIER
jgi:hypothetical protein